MEKGDKGHEKYSLYQAREYGEEWAPRGFAERARHNSHQWRIVISPEHGTEVDLTAMTRRVMQQLERDTGYAVDWVAANHYDTAHPHTHIMVRGVDREGRVVGIKRDYIRHGLTYRTQDILTQDLGPREQTLELQRTHAHDYDYDGGRERP